MTLTGPTNLLALMTSFQMGFRTLAIEQRFERSVGTLAVVKTEFGKFGAVLAGVKKKLVDEARVVDRKGRCAHEGDNAHAARRRGTSGRRGRSSADHAMRPATFLRQRDVGNLVRAGLRLTVGACSTRCANGAAGACSAARRSPMHCGGRRSKHSPFVAIYTDEELARLRAKVVLFLSAKSIVGARGHEVTPLQRVIIAIEACVLVLNLDMAYYDGWENIIVSPDEFIPGWEYEDEAGVVHRNDGPLAGESMPGGTGRALVGPTSKREPTWDSAGMNLVIHEFAHKLDMRNGEANGCPPLPATMPPHVWKKSLTAAYEHFRVRVERGDNTAIDPYAAESPAEFFAVISEVFFADPMLLQGEYRGVYKQLRWFYRQDPAARTELLLERVAATRRAARPRRRASAPGQFSVRTAKPDLPEPTSMKALLPNEDTVR